MPVAPLRKNRFGTLCSDISIADSKEVLPLARFSRNELLPLLLARDSEEDAGECGPVELLPSCMERQDPMSPGLSLMVLLK